MNTTTNNIALIKPIFESVTKKKSDGLNFTEMYTEIMVKGSHGLADKVISNLLEINGLDVFSIHKELIKELEEKEKSKNTVVNTPKIIQKKITFSSFLPSCPNNVWILPNAFLRGSLFGVVRKGQRKYQKNVLKAFVKGITVKFTGEQLDQADLDVWAECFRLNREKQLGEKIFFSSKAFLLKIGRNNGKTDRDWLYDSFRRLMGAVVEIGYNGYFYTGQLLQHWYRDEKTGKNSLILNEKLLPFFQAHVWTGVLIEQRIALTGKSLSQWLHIFYSTHKAPFEYKVKTLHQLCESKAILKKFRQMLKKSLKEIAEVTGWSCSISENDLVKIKKK